MKTRMLQAALVIAVGLPGAAGFGAAYGAEPAQSEVVRYADLDIAREPGATQLHDRIRAAIARVCSHGGVSDLHIRDLEAQCRREALAQVEAQLKTTTVAAVVVKRPSAAP